MNISKIIKRSLRMSILFKISLMCILISLVSGCFPVTIFGGVVGIGDSLDKTNRIDEIEKRIVKIERVLLTKKYRPYPLYIPSYVDMETFKIGIYDK
jgi:hypothetical protein